MGECRRARAQPSSKYSTRAQALTEAGEGAYDVTLLDANPNPGGLSAGWRTAGGRAVEAGERGAAEVLGCEHARRGEHERR